MPGSLRPGRAALPLTHPLFFLALSAWHARLEGASWRPVRLSTERMQRVDRCLRFADARTFKGCQIQAAPRQRDFGDGEPKPRPQNHGSVFGLAPSAAKLRRLALAKAGTERVEGLTLGGAHRCFHATARYHL